MLSFKRWLKQYSCKASQNHILSYTLGLWLWNIESSDTGRPLEQYFIPAKSLLNSLVGSILKQEATELSSQPGLPLTEPWWYGSRQKQTLHSFTELYVMAGLPNRQQSCLVNRRWYDSKSSHGHNWHTLGMKKIVLSS